MSSWLIFFLGTATEKLEPEPLELEPLDELPLELLEPLLELESLEELLALEPLDTELASSISILITSLLTLPDRLDDFDETEDGRLCVFKRSNPISSSIITNYLDKLYIERNAKFYVVLKRFETNTYQQITMLKTYFGIRKWQEVLHEIQTKYRETFEIFPFNVTHADIDEHSIVLKQKVNMMLRTRFLLDAIQQYWDFGRNQPGELYSLALWKEMCSYGFRFGPPPTKVVYNDIFSQNVSFTNLLYFKPSLMELPMNEKYNDLKT